MPLADIAGIPPIDLLAYERAEKNHGGVEYSDEERPQIQWSRRTEAEWQCRWDAASGSRYTHRVIPNKAEWISRKHGFVTFYLTQALTEHGCFHSHLYRIRVYQSAECLECTVVDEDLEHALFHCSRVREQREWFQATWKGSLTPEGMGRCLFSSQTGWDAVVTLATKIIEKKKKEEQPITEMQQQQRVMEECLNRRLRRGFSR